eukprot:TRINITY_DN24859_c0_g1_i2.p1 TRINITY_DN24859_c0_g1~~TRINITY_DN24859_c0_g1_i2.p1  ORF type:complete len:847 (-),score=169.97 TRINITY_DN24859_c0_g1_i2:1231-3771(-)
MSQSLPPRIIVEREDHGSSSGSDQEHSGDDITALHESYLSGGSPRSKNDSSGSGAQKLDRKESYKAQRKNYKVEKKRVEKELLSTFKDETIIVLADWLKVRGSLKSWTKLWCVLKPGLLLLFRSQKAKSSHWIGTIILSSCELIERPSKKDGFCFKLFHPMDQSVWASKGPEGESMGAVVQPLPTSHLIFRAPTNAAGKCWMDALELALRCSSLLTARKTNRNSSFLEDSIDSDPIVRYENDSDVEKHFKADLEDGGSITDEGELGVEGATERSTYASEEDESGDCSDEISVIEDIAVMPPHTNYVCDQQEVFGTTGDQTEEFSDENKSIVWFLMKQVRPGMDLSRVVLPTFILEPRSFLDKLSDYYYHADIISKAAAENEPFMRMKTVVQWYLSGFYKKPKGLKKPYNPILGETFRCYWEHGNGTKTFYLAEQVSHHPPISSFYATNRQDGFTISGTILAKSKFYGNSTSAILDGLVTLSMLARGEDYVMTIPYAHCKGILMGTMTMELGGKVNISCEKTGYNTELEFKLRPFLGGGEFTNAVSGKIKIGKETLAVIDGHWDDKVTIKDKKTGQEETLWQVTPEIKSSRLKRFTVPVEDQSEWESARLWQHVGQAIVDEDQVAATEEKTKLEVAQRQALVDRKEKSDEWVTKLFEHEGVQFNIDGTATEVPKYTYKNADIRPWDIRNDLQQYENNYIVCTKTRHKTPMIRTQSIVSVLDDGKPPNERVTSITRRRKTRDLESKKQRSQDSDTSNAGVSNAVEKHSRGSSSNSSIQDALKPLIDEQRAMSERIGKLNHSIEVCLYQQKERDSHTNLNRDLVLLVILVVMIQAVLNWVLTERANRQS